MATNTFKSNVATNIVTSGNTVYTVPAATQTTLIGLTLCNKSTSAVTATVSLTRSAVNYQIASNVSINSNTTAVIVGGSQKDRKSTRLNSSHVSESRMPSSA